MSELPWTAYMRSRLTCLGHTFVSCSISVATVTSLTILIYAAIFTSSVIQSEVVPEVPVPSQQLGLNLTTAVRDLQVIASGPHPYNSHANDVVRSHILSRVTEIAKPHNRVDIVDDLRSNATWYSEGGIYFEGNNILVKIDGKESGLGAVLFSAHFDSVSTAPGATDDGMGVATLLQLVEYFANNTPRRTVVFNINNAEEEGLLGAHAFLEHSWSSFPKNFLNLEGAGSGGRPILFRTSSTSVTRAFKDVPHPHGSVLSSDAFALGVIRSRTDFSVYQTNGMEGLDLAFYKRRSLYHTQKDSIPSLRGPNSLWIMMESALISGIALTENVPAGGIDEPAVYFDLFGETLVIFPLHTLFTLNLGFLIVGALAAAVGVVVFHSRGRLHFSQRGWFRFPLAFILGIALPFGLAVLIAHLNPYIVYSSGYTVIISLISLAFLAIYIPLASLSYWRPVPQQRLIVVLETYILWWILLVFHTVVVNNKKVGGLFVITFFHMASFCALVVTVLEHLRLSFPGTQRLALADPVEDDEIHEEYTGDEQTETTPLIQRRREAIDPTDVQEVASKPFWILGYLLLVPFPVILVTQMGTMLLGALPHTLADGNSSLLVYLALALLSFLLMLPIAPFVHNLHRYVAVGCLLLLLGTGIYNLVAFPFSTASPLKVFFYQSVNLGTGSNVVNLTGVPGYIDDYIIPSLPSSWGQSIECSDTVQRPGLRTCQWEGLAPAVVPNKMSDWLTFNATLTAPGMALIKLKGMNTRSCKVYFDHPVTSIRVENSTGEVQGDYPFPSDGITELRLWSRTWEKEFTLTAVWKGQDTMTGRVSCGWAETLGGRIPAFTEVLGFLPEWALATKASDALVEGMQCFSI